MDEISKSAQNKKGLSIALILIATIACILLGFFSISFLHDYLTSENALYKFAIIIVMIPFAVVALAALICNVISIVIQCKLKEHRSLIQFIYSFVILFFNIAFIVLLFIMLII